LLSVYFDTLLVTTKKSDMGCYIGDCFLGTLVNADDVVLLAPSTSATRKMIAICEAFANDFCVTFNCDKTKFITISTLVLIVLLDMLIIGFVFSLS